MVFIFAVCIVYLVLYCIYCIIDIFICICIFAASQRKDKSFWIRFREYMLLFGPETFVCLSVSSVRLWRLKYTELWLFLLFYMHMELYGSHSGKNIGWACSGKDVCGSKWEELTGDWRNSHNEKLHDLYWSPGFIQVMKLRRMRWLARVTCGEEGKCVQIIHSVTWRKGTSWKT
jgi:hypothetical protein